MNKVRSGSVRVIMANVFEKTKALFVLWFVKFQILMIAIPVIRKYMYEYDKKRAKFVENNTGGVKRNVRCCSCYCGPGKSWSFMDGAGILGERL